MGGIYDGQADRAICKGNAPVTCESCYEKIELTVPITRQVDDARQVLAPSHVCAGIGYLATRSRDTTSESLKPIQSARADYDLCAAFSEHDRSRLAYSAARACDDAARGLSARHRPNIIPNSQFSVNASILGSSTF